MDPTLVAALAALLGSVVGGAATIATAWVTQKTQTRREELKAEVRKRETLYSEFIVECSRLAIDALDHHLEDPRQVFQVVALQNRIKLVSSDEVVEAADATIKRILQQYFDANLTREQLQELAMGRAGDDPVKTFSRACRKELRSLRAPH
jgi:hypothetical protein